MMSDSTTNAGAPQANELEQQIGQWRHYMRRRQAVHNTDVDELEDHLRSEIDELSAAGLSEDESFLVAVKRMGNLDALSHEFAQEHSDRLWKQLVLPGTGPSDPENGDRGTTELSVVLALGLAAGLTLALLLNGINEFNQTTRSLTLAVLPFVAAYFAWKRNLDGKFIALGAGITIVSGLAASFYPFNGPSWHTSDLMAIHLPLLLWAIVGLAYVGGRWNDSRRRMDFIRFTGEAAIYYVLIALGGGVLIALTYGVFDSIGVDVDAILGDWIFPIGAAGAALVAAWLVEAKQGVIEAMAPVLTRIFSPLFTALFVVFLATVLFTGRGVDVDRDVLILFDLLLALVLGLVLYSISARNPDAPVDWFDKLQIALIVSALAIDLLGLAAIVGRISEFGFSANKTAALGENLILLVNLAGCGWLYSQFVSGKKSFDAIEWWQTSYLMVFPVWAAIVVLGFPLLFNFG